MTKKLIIIALTTALILSCTGCGKENDPIDVSDNGSTGLSTTSEDESDSSSNVEKSRIESDCKDYLLTYSSLYENNDYAYAKLYLVDENGDKKEYITDRVIDLLKEDGINVSDLNLNHPNYYAPEIGVLFAVLYFDDDYQGLYAIDIRNNRVQKIFSQYEFGIVDCMEYFDNKLHVLLYDTDDNKTEKIYSIYDDFTFSLEESEHDEVLKSIDDDYVERSSYQLSSMYTTDIFSLEKAFTEIGYVVVTDYDNGAQYYYIIGPDGNKEELDLLRGKEGNVIYYDEEKIVFAADAYRSADYATAIYTLDLENNKLDKILDLSDRHVIEAVDNKIYYTDDSGSSDNICLHEYDLKDNSDKLVYTYEKKAGVELTYSENYQIENGHIYVCDVKDADLKWFRIDGYDDEDKLIDIDCPIETINSLKYGTVELKTFEGKCALCGTTVWNGRYELFSLNKDYSKQASKINKALCDRMEEFVDNSKPYSEDESDCAYHKEEGYPGVNEEFKVSDVRIINDKFLAVDMSEFSYAGGPHGTYFTEEYIFDLDTGEELSMRNFFEGTDEEFKTFMADKVLEDKIVNPDNYEEYAGYEEGLSNKAYKYASIKSKSIHFYDDHLSYLYKVYELFAGDTGEYSIDIPYEELNGYSQLTRIK